jgi:hypothetical protein
MAGKGLLCRLPEIKKAPQPAIIGNIMMLKRIIANIYIDKIHREADCASFNPEYADA